MASAPAAECDKRRGIAGDLAVFKVAAAAAEAGSTLDEVVAVARETNRRTRSFGVAFDGCTLPGAEGALFHVPTGKMAIGLGIHGEPGISEADVPTANGLAEMLVKRLLEEVPEGIEPYGARVVPILNGLGTVKYEELFVVYRRVDELLREAGLRIVEPEVGDLVTSLDMAGVSLTLLWLDDEIARCWMAPADAPAYRKGSVRPAEAIDPAEVESVAQLGIPPASAASKDLASGVVAALDALATIVDEKAAELGRIDAVAGDGDHGIGMQRGSKAGLKAAREVRSAGAGAGTVLRRAAECWSDRAGGTSGAIWGVILTSISEALGDEHSLSAEHLATGVVAASDNVMNFGKAKPGDKTLVDVLVPFTECLSASVAAARVLVPPGREPRAEPRRLPRQRRTCCPGWGVRAPWPKRAEERRMLAPCHWR